LKDYIGDRNTMDSYTVVVDKIIVDNETADDVENGSLNNELTGTKVPLVEESNKIQIAIVPSNKIGDVKTGGNSYKV